MSDREQTSSRTLDYITPGKAVRSAQIRIQNKRDAWILAFARMTI
jgi:hypothetical protein